MIIMIIIIIIMIINISSNKILTQLLINCLMRKRGGTIGRCESKSISIDTLSRIPAASTHQLIIACP